MKHMTYVSNWKLAGFPFFVSVFELSPKSGKSLDNVCRNAALQTARGHQRSPGPDRSAYELIQDGYQYGVLNVVFKTLYCNELIIN